MQDRQPGATGQSWKGEVATTTRGERNQHKGGAYGNHL